jgi:hypothetical protein
MLPLLSNRKLAAGKVCDYIFAAVQEPLRRLRLQKTAWRYFLLSLWLSEFASRSLTFGVEKYAVIISKLCITESVGVANN